VRRPHPATRHRSGKAFVEDAQGSCQFYALLEQSARQVRLRTPTMCGVGEPLVKIVQPRAGSVVTLAATQKLS
jgi:Ni,Fe-hydrogenase III large subunit